MTASVTYTGPEVAFVIGALASVLPSLNEADYDVADLLIERALSGLDRPLPADLAERVAQLRTPPLGRFLKAVERTFGPGVEFDALHAAMVAHVSTGDAFLFLERLAVARRGIVRRGQSWAVENA